MEALRSTHEMATARIYMYNNPTSQTVGIKECGSPRVCSDKVSQPEEPVPWI